MAETTATRFVTASPALISGVVLIVGSCLRWTSVSGLTSIISPTGIGLRYDGRMVVASAVGWVTLAAGIVMVVAGVLTVVGGGAAVRLMASCIAAGAAVGSLIIVVAVLVRPGRFVVHPNQLGASGIFDEMQRPGVGLILAAIGSVLAMGWATWQFVAAQRERAAASLQLVMWVLLGAVVAVVTLVLSWDVEDIRIKG